MSVSSMYSLSREIRHRIPDWKKEHRYVYAVSIDTSWNTPVTCIFRVLTRDEMRYIEEASDYRDEWWAEGWTIGHCLLYPYPTVLDDWNAGAVSVLGESILEASGWASITAIESTLGLAREQTGTLDSAMISYILKAFPSMKAEDIGKLKFIDLIGYLAQAEVVLGEHLQTDMWLNPKRYARNVRRANRQNANQSFIPGRMDSGENINPPAEEIYSEQALRQKPQLAFQREALNEDILLSADSGKKLRSGDAINEEMMSQREFLQGGNK